MRTLRDDGWQKAIEGLTTVDEVLRITKGDQDLAELDKLVHSQTAGEAGDRLINHA